MSRFPSRLVRLTAFAILSSAGAAAWSSDTPSSDDAAQALIVTPVRANVWMLTVGGKNLVLQAGEDGAVLVDTGPPGTGAAVLEAIKKITSAPIRYVINTSADQDAVGNNKEIAAAGYMLGDVLGGSVGGGGLVGGNEGVSTGARAGAPILAYKGVLTRMIGSPPEGQTYESAALPVAAFDTPQNNLHLNEQTIHVIWQPAAHSDGDSIVQFQRDDVVVAGAVFDMTRFPVIDVAAGGSIQGEIAAINRLLDRYVNVVTPLAWRQGEQHGTLVIPGRGRLSDQSDLVQYRDMLTIIRDRVAHYMKLGKSMEQVVALKPAIGYEPRYGASDGPWTTNKFVEAIYRSLKNGKGKGGSKTDAAE